MEDLKDICAQAMHTVLGDHIAPLSAQEGWKESMLGVFTSPLVTPTTNIKYGHYQFNSTMGIAKLIKDLHYDALPSNPAELSGLFTQAMLCVQDKYAEEKGCPKPIEAVNIAGCFINIALTPAYLLSKCFDIYMAVPFGTLPKPPTLPRKRVVVDFSSPNVAKSMHVGHLRSTIIGDSICRLYEYVGYDVHRINHVGDWGTQFGMLITHLTDMHPEIADAAAHCRRITMLPIDNLVAFYKAAKERFDNDPAFQKRAYEAVVKLQRLNLAEFYLWCKICDISRHEFQRIYDRLDIKIDEFGESSYKFKLGTTVARLKRLHLTQMSDKATVIPIEGWTILSSSSSPTAALLTTQQTWQLFITAPRSFTRTSACTLLTPASRVTLILFSKLLRRLAGSQGPGRARPIRGCARKRWQAPQNKSRRDR